MIEQNRMSNTTRAWARAGLILVAGTTVALAGAAAPQARLTEGDSHLPADPIHEGPAGSENIDFGAIQRAMAGGGGGPASSGAKGTPWSKLSDGYERVVSTTNGQGFYDIWVNKKTTRCWRSCPAASRVRSTSSR